MTSELGFPRAEASSVSGMGRPSYWRDRGGRKVKPLLPSQGSLSPGPQVGLVLAGES